MNRLEFLWLSLSFNELLRLKPETLPRKKRNLTLPVAGEHDLTDDSETVTVVSKVKATTRKKHPQFYIRRAEGISKFDVALLELETPLDFGEKNISHIR